MQVQITLFDKNQVYKPLSTLLEAPSFEYAQQHRSEYINKAYQKIASKKYMTSSELYDQGYSQAKMREYNQNRIKIENMLKYVQKKRANK
jgi:hypothetical protein